jgi:hypothetical protein
MKQQILRQFLEQGILLSPEALEKISDKDAEHILEKAKSSGAVVYSPKEERALSSETTVEVRKIQKKQKISTQDLARYYNTRFEGLRDILMKKADNAISISNAKKSGGPIATIGMVREHTQRGFVIEDLTGQAEVVSKSEEALPDDVIAVRGSVREEKIFAEEIIWPDISMSHKHPDLGVKILLAGNDSHNPGEETILITPDSVTGTDKKRASLPNPGWITITKGSKTGTALVYAPEKPVSSKEAFVWLKKRHLLTSKLLIHGTDDPFTINPIPTLFWIVSSEKWCENYKGVIVVSSDGKAPAEVDLATGEVRFQD